MDNKQCYRQLHQVVTDLRDEYTPKMVRATTDYSRAYTHPPRKKILGVFPTRKTGVNTRAEEEKSTCILLYRNAKNAFIRDMRHAVEDLCGDVSREVGRDIVEASCVFGYCMVMDGGYCEAQRNGLTIPFDGLEYIHPRENSGDTTHITCDDAKTELLWRLFTLSEIVSFSAELHEEPL